ncbi:MAG TPA: ABC transporter permease [Vicinamibacterales bacterium]
METLLQDIRYAIVMMRRNVAFTAAALSTLALGIGATTAVFSVVYGVLLRPLPYPQADRLVQISEEHPGAVSPMQRPMLSNLTYYAWGAAPRTIDALAASDSDTYTVGLPDGTATIHAADVTPSMFPLLGESPAMGRFFTAEDAAAGADHVVVLSDRAWRERFHADPRIIGRGIMIDDRACTIVGVGKPGFYFPDRETMLWKPLTVRPASPNAVAGQRGAISVLTAYARLKPGVTPQQAEAEGTAAARTTVRPLADSLLFGVGGPLVVHVRGVVDEMTSRIRPTLLVLAAAVICVLLIACANVANLFLSRGVARQREITVRAAIGAGRGRLARQLLTESVVLSVIGGAIGIFAAWGVVRAMPALAPPNFPRLDQVRVDARTLVFAAAAIVSTALFSGLAPALGGSRVNLAGSLHGGDGASASGFRGRGAQRLRDLLLGGEAAFAVMLLVGALLLARSFVRLTHVDAGYTPSGVLTVSIFVPGGVAPTLDGSMTALALQSVERVRALPGVVAAGAANMMPLDRSLDIVGFPAPWTPSGSARPPTARALAYWVTPGYAEALALRFRAGRAFTQADFTSATRYWIVNETFARQYLPSNPVGYQFPWNRGNTKYTAEILGVVADVLKSGNDAKPQPEMYTVARDGTLYSGHFEIALRTAGNPASLAPAVRNALLTLAPTASIETATLSRLLEQSVDQPRFAMTVLISFAVLALTLAAIGLYGVLSYAVSQRRRELGVRSALGASRSSIVVLVVREGVLLAGSGGAIGLAGAALLTRLMQGALFGVGPLDATSFASAPVILLPIALVACLVPALRAAATDPAEALRHE